MHRIHTGNQTMIGNLVTLQDMHHGTPDYVKRLSTYEKHFFTKASKRCYERGQILKENATKSLDRCLKDNEFIMNLVNDLKFPSISEDGLPFPTLNILDQLKEEHEHRVVETMKLTKFVKVFHYTKTYRC